MQNAHLTTGRRLVGVPTIDKGGIDELELFGRYATSSVSPTVQVGASPVVLKAYGLLDGETVTVQNVYQPTGVTATYRYKGDPIVLTNALSTAILPLSGNYNLVFAGATLGQVLVTATTLSGRVGEPNESALRSQLARPNLYFGPGITDTVTQKIQITSKPWVFRAYGMQDGASIQVINVTNVDGVEVEAPYLREGDTTALSIENTTCVLEIAGSYRFQIIGPQDGVLLVGNENPIVFIDPYIPQGEPGPAGTPGQPGDSTAFNVIAGVDLTWPIVVAVDNGIAHPADPTSDDDMISQLALTTRAATAGSTVTVNTTWQHSELAWNWAPGRIYLGLAGGALANAPDPSVGAILEVGRVVNPTTIQFGIQPATLRH